jgi:diguanylate cyclase (GGDEF)-like protein
MLASFHASLSAAGADSRLAVPLLGPLFDALEQGIVIVEPAGTILFANHAFAEMVGIAPAALVELSAEALVAHVRSLVELPPPLLAGGHILPSDRRLVCEEFELSRPTRSVVRWVAQQVVLADRTLVLVACSDVTTEVDVVAAHTRLAMIDRLTGVFNRRGLEQLLGSERLRRAGSSSVAIIDVDHFKRVNDNHGHAAGDEVLRHVSGAIRQALREGDSCGRWGGEEFLLVLPGCDLKGALLCAERVRVVIESMSAGPVRVTVSVGVAQLAGDEPWQQAVQRADEGLYRAKAGGRNRVC